MASESSPPRDIVSETSVSQGNSSSQSYHHSPLNRARQFYMDSASHSFVDGQPGPKRHRASCSRAEQNIDLSSNSLSERIGKRLSSSPGSASVSNFSTDVPRVAKLMKRTSRAVSGDLIDLHYKNIEETQKREACEREITLLREAFTEIQEQNESLRQETRSLQLDNSVLLRQLNDQNVNLSAVTFDAERYKNKLEENQIEVPISMFLEVSKRSKIPKLQLQSGSLPLDLLEAAELTEEEKSDFCTVASLVTRINELQIRLRDSRASRLTVADERVAELESLVSAVECQLAEVRESKELLKSQYEIDLQNVVKKNDALMGKLDNRDLEITKLKAELEKSEREEKLIIAELKIEEYEKRILSLDSLLEQTNAEISSLRATNGSLTAASVVTDKELEYLTSSLKRERDQSSSIRSECDFLRIEMNSARASSAQRSTEALMLQNRVELLERAAKAKEDECEEWRSRLLELQKQMAEDQVRWDRSVQESIAKSTRLEMSTVAAKEEANQYLTQLKLLQDKSNKLSEMHTITLAEKESQIRLLKVSLTTEETARSAAISKMERLNAELLAAEEAKTLLAEKILSMESQAALLKSKHPQLDFGVMEEEIRRHEAEKRTMNAEVAALNKALSVIETDFNSKVDLVTELKGKVESQIAVIESNQADIEKLTSDLSAKAAELSQKEQEFDEMALELAQSRKHLVEMTEKLTTSDERLQKLGIEIQGLQTGQSSEVNRLKLELEEAQLRLATVKLDLENVSQGHRLEVQAHSRDVDRLEMLQKMLQSEKTLHSEDNEKYELRLREKETSLTTISTELSDVRRRCEAIEAQRRLMLEENESTRRLLQEKFDSMECGDDELRRGLAERLKIEEKLQQEVVHAAVEKERLKLIVKGLENEILALKDKVAQDCITIEELQLKLETSSPLSSPFEASRARQLGDLQMRIEILEHDLQMASEQRRLAQRNLEELLKESVPLRKREAMLQGELLSTKNALEISEKDVELYKQKYSEVTKGFNQGLEAQKTELLTKISLLESQKADMENSVSQLSQQLSQVGNERNAAKLESEKLGKEISSLKSQLASSHTQIESLQSQIQTLQAQKSKIDNTDITKRYQVQLSNLQRLVQSVNTEKDNLNREIVTHQSQLSERKAQICTLESKLGSQESKMISLEGKIEELKQEHQKQIQQQSQKNQILIVDENESKDYTIPAPLLNSLNNLLDDTVRIAILAAMSTRKAKYEEDITSAVVATPAQFHQPSTSGQQVAQKEVSNKTQVPYNKQLSQRPIGVTQNSQQFSGQPPKKATMANPHHSQPANKRIESESPVPRPCTPSTSEVKDNNQIHNKVTEPVLDKPILDTTSESVVALTGLSSGACSKSDGTLPPEMPLPPDQHQLAETRSMEVKADISEPPPLADNGMLQVVVTDSKSVSPELIIPNTASNLVDLSPMEPSTSEFLKFEACIESSTADKSLPPPPEIKNEILQMETTTVLEDNTNKNMSDDAYTEVTSNVIVEISEDHNAEYQSIVCDTDPVDVTEDIVFDIDDSESQETADQPMTEAPH